MIVRVYIGNKRLDLFEDESIKIQSSILSSQDISKVTGDFSKSFTVPASDNNNNIFKHYYNANIDNSFDARTKQEGRIELGGLPFKRGKFSLMKVNVKQELASSYTVLFLGKMPNIKDAVGDDELSVLDFAQYDHLYNSDNVKAGLKSQLYGDEYIYIPFVKSQYYYNSDPSDQTNTDTLKNIAYHNASQSNFMGYQEFKPAIKVYKIIEAIELKYGFNFSNDFFGREEFLKLYMWLNNKENNISSIDSEIVNFTSGDTDHVNLATNKGYFETTNTGGIMGLTLWDLTLILSPQSGFGNVSYKVKVYIDGELDSIDTYQGNSEKIITLASNEDSQVYEVYYVVESSENFNFTTTLKQKKIRPFFGDEFFYTDSALQTLESSVFVQNNIPKIKIIDFLKGLFQMFKLIVIPENDTDIYINDIKSYYSQGKLHEVTKYIDFKDREVSRGDLLSEINYKFKEPKTILNQQFKKNTGIAYGDELLSLEDSDGEPLDGGKQDISLPFEQIVYERLVDLQDSQRTNFMYGAIIDEDLKKENPEPHLFYKINQNIGSKTFAFKNDSGSIEEFLGVINIPSHTIDFTDRMYSTIFSSELNEWDGQLINNTLYRNYHDDFIISLFNIKRRNFRFKSRDFPLHLITTLKLNDVLKIRDNYYRIDNYQVDLTNGETTLNLINSFDNNLVGFSNFQTSFILDASSQRVSTYVPDLEDFNAVSDEWLRVYNVGKNIYIEFEKNETLSYRSKNIGVPYGGKSLQIKTIQTN